ncbi:DNA phosphorothioation-associated putative methyltransferase [Candidatus Rariloculus sp.]|uniref:DNA phosphorothioation-associated putative methyltransferase n=1 Tax=Candidatus Rariloculus sp. TaxID=3101265 RepID=UPI003D133710
MERTRRLKSRARTAIGRAELSRPFKCAIRDGLIGTDTRILDYGCGRGDDLRRLSAMGYPVRGWDPVHRADGERTPSPVVNLGYVVNVIENVQERCDVLRRAWELAEKLMVVSARLSLDVPGVQSREYEDGCLTSRGTFQKFFEQQELRNWIDSTLGNQAVAAAPGVFYVFRDEAERANFVSARYRRRGTAPRFTASAELFRAHEKTLEPLMQFFGDRGRLPSEEELAGAEAIVGVFGSLRRAFRVVLTVTDGKDWERIEEERRQDLMVYLALAQFDGRSPYGRLPRSLQRDVKAFFGVYKRACVAADELLFSLGGAGTVDDACKQPEIGKLTPNALYVHVSALPALSPTLRLYEGCASGYVGRIDGVNIIKLHRNEPKVSYLTYPRFDKDAHPALGVALSVHLQTFRIRVRDYRSRRNRPILHRKELLVSPEYPGFRKFARLTRIEESKGLYRKTDNIGYEEGWKDALVRKGLYLRGHRLLSIARQSAEIRTNSE